ncbi:MAG: hypothetical protein AUG44_22860 [Actinobacteria bacterium 13_1_20CM_3_71_11]|nr:MAG: hypothetical protein AUG44_22860 [Actinobacteria bacterium 13_1_20CM_3_71_11]
MDAARKQQFAHIAAAKTALLGWAQSNDIPLVRVEFVVPFVETDFSLSVWLFYDTNANVTRAAADGTTTNVEQEFQSILSAAGYPTDWLSRVSFYIDSHENVERDYEGSYFYRLR